MLSQHGHCSSNSHISRRTITLRGLFFFFEIVGCKLGEKTNSLLPIPSSDQMIPVSLKGGKWWAIKSFFMAKVFHGLGSAFSEDDLGWNLSSCVCLLLDQLGPKWQMEDLQSVSLPWKEISKGAQSQQGWECRAVLLHATALLVGKQRKGLDFQKDQNFLDFFFLLWKKNFCFGKRSDRCGLYYAEKNVLYRNL